MKIFKDADEEIIGGWFVGDFEPTCFRTKEVDVAYKVHKKGSAWDTHYHKVVTEINYMIRGKMTVQGQEFNEGDCFIMEPGDIADPVYLEDTEIICVKIPSLKDDKHGIN